MSGVPIPRYPRRRQRFLRCRQAVWLACAMLAALAWLQCGGSPDSIQAGINSEEQVARRALEHARAFSRHPVPDCCGRMLELKCNLIRQCDLNAVYMAQSANLGIQGKHNVIPEDHCLDSSSPLPHGAVARAMAAGDKSSTASGFCPGVDIDDTWVLAVVPWSELNK